MSVSSGSHLYAVYVGHMPVGWFQHVAAVPFDISIESDLYMKFIYIYFIYFLVLIGAAGEAS